MSELLAFAPAVLFAPVSAFAAWRISRTGRSADAPNMAHSQRDNPQCRLPADAGWDAFFDTPGIDIKRDQPPAQKREAF